MNRKHWILIATASLFLACSDGRSDKAPHGTALGSGGPAASGPASGPAGAAHMGGGDPKAGGPNPHDGDDNKAPAEVTIYLMGRFKAALKDKPTNAEPNPAWVSLLADPSNPVECQDCHAADIVKNMLSKFDPTVRPDGADVWEKNTDFMKGLMTKWVKRANDDKHGARGKLTGELKCTSCHAKDPSQG